MMEKEDTIEKDDNWALYTIYSLKVDKILKSAEKNKIWEVSRKDFGDLVLKKIEEADSVSETVLYPQLYSRSSYAVLLGRVIHVDQIFEDGHGYSSQSLQMEEVAFKNDIRVKKRKIFAASGLALIFKHIVRVGDFICILPAKTKTTQMDTYISLNERHNESVLIAHLTGNPKRAGKYAVPVVSTKLREACRKYYIRTDIVKAEDSSEVRRFAPIRKTEKEYSPFERYAMLSLQDSERSLPPAFVQSPSPKTSLILDSSIGDFDSSVFSSGDASPAEPPTKKFKMSKTASSDCESGNSGPSNNSPPLIDKVRRSITAAARRLIFNPESEEDCEELTTSDSGYMSVSQNQHSYLGEVQSSGTLETPEDEGQPIPMMRITLHPLNGCPMIDREFQLPSNTLWGSCRENLEENVAASLPEEASRIILLFYRTQYGILRPLPEDLQLSEILSLSERKDLKNELQLHYEVSDMEEILTQ